MKVIDISAAKHAIPVQINVSAPIPVGTEPQVNEEYLRCAKELMEVMHTVLPCGIVDRLLWLWLGKETEYARDNGSPFTDTMYAAWEVLDQRVNPRQDNETATESQG